MALPEHFSFLSEVETDNSTIAGTYDFGFIDSDKFTGQITYTNVNTTPGYWTHAATFGSTTVNGISDTGTTLLCKSPMLSSSFCLIPVWQSSTNH